jgi:hypothetical protein
MHTSAAPRLRLGRYSCSVQEVKPKPKDKDKDGDTAGK